MKRRVSIMGFVCCALIMVGVAADTRGADTNEEFVKQRLRNYFTEVVDRLPVSGSDSISVELTAPPTDNLGLSSAALGDCLRSRGLTVLANGENRGPLVINCNMSELRLKYIERNGGLFSRGSLFRVLDIASNFSYSAGGTIVSNEVLTASYDEQISLSERIALEQKFSPLFHADLPPGPVQRLWEPLIVTTVIGGLVYLFFASR